MLEEGADKRKFAKKKLISIITTELPTIRNDAFPLMSYYWRRIRAADDWTAPGQPFDWVRRSVRKLNRMDLKCCFRFDARKVARPVQAMSE